MPLSIDNQARHKGVQTVSELVSRNTITVTCEEFWTFLKSSSDIRLITPFVGKKRKKKKRQVKIFSNLMPWLLFFLVLHRLTNEQSCLALKNKYWCYFFKKVQTSQITVLVLRFTSFDTVCTPFALFGCQIEAYHSFQKDIFVPHHYKAKVGPTNLVVLVFEFFSEKNLIVRSNFILCQFLLTMGIWKCKIFVQI